jgi:hypothetical protein
VLLGHHDVWQEHYTTSLNILIVPGSFETDISHPMRQNCADEVTCNRSRSTSLHKTGDPSILLTSILEILQYCWPVYWKYYNTVDQYTGNTTILWTSILEILQYCWPVYWK